MSEIKRKQNPDLACPHPERYSYEAAVNGDYPALCEDPDCKPCEASGKAWAAADEAEDRAWVAAQQITYTHPSVFTDGVEQGWAEAETDPARIDWPARQARAAIPFEVIDGRPVNPCEKTGITRGRNKMGYWGETLMADALVTLDHAGVRYLLMIERGDGYGWAVPGGHVEPGETGLQAAVREMAEETGLDPHGWPSAVFREMPPRYVPDPRSSDEAWAVTIPVVISLGTLPSLPAVAGGDDARRAGWVPADSYGCLTRALASRYGGRVFAAHAGMLREFLAGPDGDAGVTA